MLDQFLSARCTDDWNMAGLSAALRAMGLDGHGHVRGRAVGGRRPRGDGAHLRDLVDARSSRGEREFGEEDWAPVERLVLLRTIDALWVEHLTELDDMRRGIGLRGYAQLDPLNEFRREAYAPVRGAARADPPPGRDDDLPCHGHAASRPRAPSRCPGPGSRLGGREARLRGRGQRVERGLDGRRLGGRRHAAAGGRAAAGGLDGRPRRDGAFRSGAPAAGAAAGLAACPAPRPPAARASRSATSRSARAGAGSPRCRRARLHADRSPHRAQRPVLVRLGPEVQEVPRSLTHPGHHGARGTLAALSSRRVRLGSMPVSRGRRGPYATCRIRDQGGPRRDSGRPAPSSCWARLSTTGGRRPSSWRGCDHAVQLCLAGFAPYLVVTGGKLPGDRTTEAAVARRYAVEQGVPSGPYPARGRGPARRRVHHGRGPHPARTRPPGRPVRVRSDAHAARPPHGPGPRHHGMGLADADHAPMDRDPGLRLRGHASRARRAGAVLRGRRTPIEFEPPVGEPLGIWQPPRAEPGRP